MKPDVKQARTAALQPKAYIFDGWSMVPLDKTGPSAAPASQDHAAPARGSD
jgi:hypothetical protein